MNVHDVVVVGAGPYGLAAGAHLSTIGGLKIKVLGHPMSFWADHMPSGMLLRSPWAGSHIGDPQRKWTLDAFDTALGIRLKPPVPLERFVEYGRWFGQQAIQDVERCWVRDITATNGSFRLVLDDDEQIETRRVVIAAGIEAFAWKPPLLAQFPEHMVSHACHQRDLAAFTGKQVLVIGGGQSALECAALLSESGARAEVLVRAPTIRFLRHRLHSLGVLSRLLYAPPDVGPAGVSQIVARPNLFRTLPRGLQNSLGQRSIRPAGAQWLESRLTNVRVTRDAIATRATVRGNTVEVSLSNGTTRAVDHVLLATGYRVDIARYPFLSKRLLDSVRQIDGAPILNRGFESSVRGLHFLGAPAAWSFGPLMRFVAGTSFAGETLQKWIARFL